ncbi:MAG: DUF4293 domain-containing protein [Chitinophagaceae bacterium]|nr:DUF4293 domain-containing protein [Chitinophagaceae bacterium]
MLQRMQSVWLLLAGTFAFLTIRFAVYTGTTQINNGNEYAVLTAGSNFFLLISTIASALVALIAIFLYKNRSLQIKLGFAALALYILSAGLYYLQIKNFSDGAFSLTSVFFFLIPVCLLLAIKSIYRDQKLVKSIDRLR